MSSKLREDEPGEGRPLQVHGFVLAGGKSSRMGVDKATLEFCGRPLIEIAVEKLRRFCAEVSIAGRAELGAFAPAVVEERKDAGPAAGMEAGLGAASQAWAVFIPVDVPLVPMELVRAWVSGEMKAELASDGGLLRSCGARLPWASYLTVGARVQPAVALLHMDCLGLVSEAMDAGVRKLGDLFEAIRVGGGVVTAREAAGFAAGATPLDVEVWFSNLNTPADFDEAELWASGVRDEGSAVAR